MDQWYQLYGINEYNKVIETIIQENDAADHYFELKVILTEAITNAYKHGNKQDPEKLIKVGTAMHAGSIKFQVIDSNDKSCEVTIPDSLDEENLLDASGRGLFLINTLADQVAYQENTLFISKKLRG